MFPDKQFTLVRALRTRHLLLRNSTKRLTCKRIFVFTGCAPHARGGVGPARAAGAARRARRGGAPPPPSPPLHPPPPHPRRHPLPLPRPPPRPVSPRRRRRVPREYHAAEQRQRLPQRGERHPAHAGGVGAQRRGK